MLNRIFSKKLVLGSKSPRRMQLMKDAGFEFEIRTLDTDEDFDEKMPAIEVAEMLALRKAEALRPSLQIDECLITADSVVIINEKIYNKPADYEEGMEMLEALSGQSHIVATGVCIKDQTKTKTFTVITEVTFDEMDEIEKDYYLTVHQPFDKAGGYGIQEWIGLVKVARINGSYTNVMGLPMREVYLALKDF